MKAVQDTKHRTRRLCCCFTTTRIASQAGRQLAAAAHSYNKGDRSLTHRWTHCVTAAKTTTTTLVSVLQYPDPSRYRSTDTTERLVKVLPTALIYILEPAKLPNLKEAYILVCLRQNTDNLRYTPKLMMTDSPEL